MPISDINILPRDQIHAEYLRAARQSKNEFVFPHRLASGEIRTVEVHSTPITINQQEVLFSIIHDITERRRAEEALAHHMALLANLLDSIPDIIFFKDPNGTYLGCNPAFATYTGKTQSEIIGRTDYDLFSQEVSDAFRKQDLTILAEAVPRHNEEWITYSDGRRILIDTFKAPLRAADGTVIGLLGISRDITERKRAEEVIAANLKEKETLLREIHHRVKNNLQIVASLLSLQSRTISDPGILGALSDTQNWVKAMALVHERLYRSTSISRIDLADYVKYLALNLFRFYSVSSQKIQWKIEAPHIEVNINTAIPLGLVVNELITNAIKYGFPLDRRGELFIILQKNGQDLTLMIKDNGVGIPKNFDWQNAESMGMRLINNLVEQLDGTVSLNRSSGTAFTITVKDKE